MSSHGIITSLFWVKQGWARSIPLEYEEEGVMKEYKAVDKKLKTKGKLSGKETIKEATTKLEGEIEDLDLKEVEMNNEEENEEINDPVFCNELKEYYAPKDEGMIVDGEASGQNQYPEGFDDVSDEDEEDFTIHSTDNLIACATAQDDFSNIEVYVYDEKHQSLYVHHDIVLSTFPLCIEWLPFKNNNKANYAAVGGFLPEIEIWNLDVLDVLEPEVVLGPCSEDSEKYFKNFKKKKNKDANSTNVHTDSVMTLNINPLQPAYLASGGADGKILVWDLGSNPQTAAKSIQEHKGKIQSVRWNKFEDNVLISGSFDKTIKLFDVRTDNSCTTLGVTSDIECLEWSPLNKFLFLSSYENGRVELYDIRKFDTLLNFTAHKKEATSVSFSNKQEGLFASVSRDCTVKVWDAENLNHLQDSSVSPSLIMEKFVKKTTVLK